MAGEALIEIREPGLAPRQVTVDRGLELGRECDGEVILDPSASRRHVKLLPSPLGLSIVDLGSRNGTLINGVPVTNQTKLSRGDVIRLGATELVVLAVGVDVPLVAARRPAIAADLRIPAPPAAPVPVLAPTRVRVLARGIFVGGNVAPGSPVFRNFLELPRRIPVPVWQAIRFLSIAAYLALVVALFVRPAGGLFTFFRVIVPLLPILFFVAPGLWRNICPLAAANQTPRVFGFSRALTPPSWVVRRGYLVAITLFFGIAGARLALFNTSADATGVLLALTIVNAFVAGVMFKGKSGWCSSICPLLPLQRVYGQTPLVLVANSHCSPCVACTKNCYDFKPEPAEQADLYDPEDQWSAPRKLFASALPGFVLGFFTLLTQPGAGMLHLYGRLLLFMIGSVGLFYAVQALLGLSIGLVVAVWASAAINIFYWYASLTLAGDVAQVFGTGDVDWLRWPLRLALLVVTVVWISRTYFTERRFLVASGVVAPPLLQIAAMPTKLTVAATPEVERAEVRFLPDDAAPVEVGTSLLEIAEARQLPIEAGCRMGVCGADPVAVLAGTECLSESEDEELTTIRRLGLGASTRMACVARVQHGSVDVSLTPERAATTGATPLNFDRSITSVVVLGGGIAGVTAADFVRRGHPDCEVHLVGMESHLLYNRMGISRLVYGRSAMTGLYLLDEGWYAENNITTWLNTIAADLDVAANRVRLATGDLLVYDRLILATGSSSTLPPISGFGSPGCFVLRQAADAIQIRSYSQLNSCRRATVAGGGLLGLEAAYALRQLGLEVTVLERGTRLLSKQIDERCSELLQAHFAGLGIGVVYGAEARGVRSSAEGGRIDTLELKDGRRGNCDILLACVGIRPNADLPQRAGLAVGRGVIVDDHMQTSVAGVYAAGDVAEHHGTVSGLWPIAAKQGEIAALNALGGDVRLGDETSATILKGVDLELSSVGRLHPESEDEVFVDEDASAPSYRRVIVSRGVVVGAIVLGHNVEFLNAALAAVKQKRPLDEWTLAELRNGKLDALATAGRAVTA